MIDSWRREIGEGAERGFTLIELTIVLAIFTILATIAIPLYANGQARARIEQAQADLRMLASAVTKYSDHMGTLPAALNRSHRHRHQWLEPDRRAVRGHRAAATFRWHAALGRLHLHVEQHGSVLRHRVGRWHDHYPAVGTPTAATDTDRDATNEWHGSHRVSLATPDLGFARSPSARSVRPAPFAGDADLSEIEDPGLHLKYPDIDKDVVHQRRRRGILRRAPPHFTAARRKMP